jgi:hypothetical protein
MTTAVVSFLGGIFAATVGVAVKSLYDLQLKKAELMFSKRGQPYEALWKLTELFPLRPRNRVTYSDLRGFQLALRDWYFSSGGLYLSVHAKYAFIVLQESLIEVLSNGDDGDVVKGIYDTMQRQCSHLRGELTSDLASRHVWRSRHSRKMLILLESLHMTGLSTEVH